MKPPCSPVDSAIWAVLLAFDARVVQRRGLILEIRIPEAFAAADVAIVSRTAHATPSLVLAVSALSSGIRIIAGDCRGGLVRLPKVEAELELGSLPPRERIQSMVRSTFAPSPDIYASADYKSSMAGLWIADMLHGLTQQPGGTDWQVPSTKKEIAPRASVTNRISLSLNGTARTVQIGPQEILQALLQRIGIPSVRMSDDGEGFTGSDTVLFDGAPALAGLMRAAQADGHDVETIESLSSGGVLSALQGAMLDAGVVQSAFNSPAAALLLTELARRKESPSEDDIRDALSGLFSRSTGYRQFFDVMASSGCRDPDGERIVGEPLRRVDGVKLVSGMKAFVEDRVEPGSMRASDASKPARARGDQGGRHVRRGSNSGSGEDHHVEELPGGELHLGGSGVS